MIRCTFAGHRTVYGVTVSDIKLVLERIILESDSIIECFVGGMGEFDFLCASAVRDLKRKYRNREILLILVLPYMRKRINTEKEYYDKAYDLILIPAALEGVHYKRAIMLRNRWMIDQADYVIAMVQRNNGGAYTSLKYAQKMGKKIINLADKK